MSSHSMYRVLPPSEPPDGERSRRFRLAVVGGTQLRGSWYLSAIVWLQGFSSGSPAASPRRWSPKTVTTSSMVGRSEPGCGLCPALSFKDLHHPCWGGGRAEPELYLPHGFVGHPLLQHSGERVLTGLAEGADSDNAGLVGRERRQLQCVGLAGSAGSGSAPGAPFCRTSGRRAARTGGPPKTSRAARAAFVFLGCPAFAPVRRLFRGGRCSPVQEDPSGDLPVGRWLPSSALRWWRLQKSSLPTRSPPPSVLRASDSLALIACPRPSSGDVGEELVTAASALRSSLLLFGHSERRSLSLLPERASATHQGFCRPAGPPMWGVVRTCGSGTGVLFVMAP
jgi:hypothetical protein